MSKIRLDTTPHRARFRHLDHQCNRRLPTRVGQIRRLRRLIRAGHIPRLRRSTRMGQTRRLRRSTRVGQIPRLRRFPTRVRRIHRLRPLGRRDPRNPALTIEVTPTITRA